jgi:hypothetical protein
MNNFLSAFKFHNITLPIPRYRSVNTATPQFDIFPYTDNHLEIQLLNNRSSIISAGKQVK